MNNHNFKNYLITDPKYYSNNKELFKENLTKALKNHKIDLACFRDKSSSNFKELALIFIETCKKFNIEKILLNGDYLLSHELKANGVHLTSTQFDKIKEAKELGLYVIISCHSLSDIQIALDNKVDAVTYSPIFETPNKGEPKGIIALEEAIYKYPNINIIALGGIINEEQIMQISKTKAYGIASIRYFV
ncbi:thiamine phosphate synthase (TMP-TENI domain) [Arcobacter venerupis]|uniref:Thiamine phosphate synthase (TMP-TENI domain) n=1 Tax=Arcobacter venerupis TaxID=1054033 RepID=A0AAE7BCS9_9BACT|nr:thiamine phosphate synthase [Arcobacter venerupis]QKF68205.1 thiamine phosphate synthase (TMP-TENI domain) [Arcobacter venerupis]RWS48589.1 thiamine phosphate synthase [Arcobacter venerupis]